MEDWLVLVELFLTKNQYFYNLYAENKKNI